MISAIEVKVDFSSEDSTRLLKHIYVHSRTLKFIGPFAHSPALT